MPHSDDNEDVKRFVGKHDAPDDAGLFNGADGESDEENFKKFFDDSQEDYTQFKKIWLSMYSLLLSRGDLKRRSRVADLMVKKAAEAEASKDEPEIGD